MHAAADHQLATFDVATDSLGHSHRAIKVPCDNFGPTVKVEEALAAAHSYFLDLQVCVNSAVLCTRNVMVDEFSAWGAAEEKGTKRRTATLMNIQIRSLGSHRNSFNGIDVIDDHKRVPGKCDSPGVLPPHGTVTSATCGP